MMFDPMSGWNRPQGPQRGAGGVGAQSGVFGQTLGAPQQGPQSGGGFMAPSAGPGPTAMPPSGGPPPGAMAGGMAPGREVSGRGDGNPNQFGMQSAAMRGNAPQPAGGYGGPTQSAAMPFQGNPYGQMRPQQRPPMYGQMMAQRLRQPMGGGMRQGPGQMQDF